MIIVEMVDDNGSKVVADLDVSQPNETAVREALIKSLGSPVHPCGLCFLPAL